MADTEVNQLTNEHAALDEDAVFYAENKSGSIFSSGKIKWSTLKSLVQTFLSGSLVTNGDSHNHNGGDGAQVDHATLSNIGTLTHVDIDALLKANATEKSVSSGVLTVDASHHKVQPESGTADDVDTISGMADGTLLVLTVADDGTDTLTYKHGTGNISCFGGNDIEHISGVLTAYRDGATVYLAGGGGGESAPAGGSGVTFKNLLINGDFRINQEGYVSSVALAAGEYGHDGWKAGVGGGDYSFTQLDSSTIITIASSKTLIQVVEDKNVQGGSYVLSWTGTAQARYGVDSDTPSGAYASSPITITGQTAGTTMSVEFDDGTLSKVQLEAGSTATEFEHLPYDVQLDRCQWLYEQSFFPSATIGYRVANGTVVTTSLARFMFEYKKKRTVPTISISDVSHFQIDYRNSSTDVTVFAIARATLNRVNFNITGTGTPLTSGDACLLSNKSTSAMIKIDARL